MLSRPDAVEDTGIEEGVGLPEGEASSPDGVEIVGHVDLLGRCYIEKGDVYVRVRSLTDPELGLATRVTRIIDVTPLGSDNEVEASVECGAVGHTNSVVHTTAVEQTPRLLLSHQVQDLELEQDCSCEPDMQPL